MTLLTAALNAGAECRIAQRVPGKCIFQASLTWPDSDEYRGPIAMTAEDALLKLEAALRENTDLRPLLEP